MPGRRRPATARHERPPGRPASSAATPATAAHISTWSPAITPKVAARPPRDAAFAGRGDQRQVAGAGNRQKNDDRGDESAVVCYAKHGIPPGRLSKPSLRYPARWRFHPDDAALGIQTRHLKLFHVKHFHFWRQARRFRPSGCLPFMASQTPCSASAADDQVTKSGQRGKGAGSDHVVRSAQVFDPVVHAAQVRQLPVWPPPAGRRRPSCATVSTQSTRISGQQIAITTPGSPAPDPTSSRLIGRPPVCRRSGADHRQAVEQVLGQHLGRSRTAVRL